MSPGPRAAAVRAALRGAAPANASVRDMIRRYCREHGKDLACLAHAWNCKVLSVWRVFGRKRPLLPRQVEGVISLFQLDEFDANDLRLRAAREAGWQIDPSMLLQEDA
ncbi:hypothetical protein [Stenotrophomonas sp. NPDC077659]|uniref:hypothetical protein n=1 Tax=Stenotrophomonas sp. NPDC077659 TaxID=3390694 RepID=UPI003D02E482